MTRARDSQRSKVYDAEDEYRTSIVGEGYREIWEIQRWVNEIVKSQWWTTLYPGIIAVKVKDGRRRRSACGGYNGNGTGEIKLPRGFRYKVVILHELAHVVTQYLDLTAAWHGEVFVGRFLDLVDRWIGKLEGLALRWFFCKLRVKWQERHCQKGYRNEAESARSGGDCPGQI